jgi:outer membrane protein assembly factor BamB
MFRSICLLGGLVLVPGLVCAEVDWPQFRGPKGDGHSAAQRVPVKWSESDHVAWKTPIPGRGWSSPAIADGLLWITTAVEKPADERQITNARLKLIFNPMAKEMKIVGAISLKAIAVDVATGEIKHDIPLSEVTDPQPVHSLNTYASPSPVLDGQRLFCHFGTFGTACVDTASANVVWKTKLVNEHSVGPGSSPVLFQDRLVVPCDGADAQHVIGLDANTGETVWKTKRPPLAGFVGDMHKAFSTPLLVTHDGQPQAISVGAQWVVAYDPQTGEEIWRVRFAEGYSNVPRPIAGNGMVYICTGYTQPQLWAIKLGGKGDVTTSHVAWQVKKQVSAMPSPILVDDLLYMISDQGVLNCIDANTGATVWTHRVAGNYSASPLYAGGKLYFSNRDGRTTVVQPGREYVEVAVNDLDGQLMASPVALDGALLLRTRSHMYRIAE